MKMKITAQEGSITLVIIIFISLMIFVLLPRDYPEHQNPACSLGIKPIEEKIITMPGIYNFAEANGGGRQGGPDENNPNVQYILVREDVPFGPIGEDIFVNTNHTLPYKDPISVTKHGVTNKYQVYYPSNYGEYDAPFEFSAPYENKGNSTKFNQYRFRQEGFLYFIKVNPDGSLFKDIDGKKIYIIDMYQMVDINRDSSRSYDDDGKIFECNEDQDEVVNKVNNTIVIPSQSPSNTKDQLQLLWFKFGSSAYMGAHCKPAVYLYPKDKQLVNVKVNTKGYLTYVDPKYPKDGWTVTAYPDGKIMDNLKPYDYLYYESKLPETLISKPQKGWVVKSLELRAESLQWFLPLEDKLNEILPQLGLNSVQTNDFITYWKKALPYSPYYFIGIADQAEINNAEPLEITPKPDYINRVRVYFERLNEKKTVQAPELNTELRAQSSGFSVIEWGGLIKNDPNHPFICSQ